MKTSISAWFDDSFSESAGKRAVSFFRGTQCETELTYDQLKTDSAKLAGYLSEYGLEKGDRIAFLMEKSVFFIVAYLAVLKAGYIAVPLNPGFKTNELEYLINDSDPELIFVDDDKKNNIKKAGFKNKLIEIKNDLPYSSIEFFSSFDSDFTGPEILQHDPALIIYTSGTTGNPKGAVLTHSNLINDALNIIKIWQISEQDVLCHALPLFHIHGLCFALNTCFICSSFIVMLDSFNLNSLVSRLSEKDSFYQCSIFMAVPAMYTKLMDLIEDRKIDFSHIRLLTSGSAPLPEKEFVRIKKIFGKEPVEREGMSETGMNFSNPLKGIKKPGSIGLPLPGVQVKIVNHETYEDVEEDQVGEIFLKSPSIIKEYWKKPDETRAAFHCGWFKTGDLGKRDSDGYYYLTDRLKHIIITGGENVSAKQVEDVINSIDGVKEAAVVGIPDRTWGETVAALVQKVPGSDLTDSEIKKICRQNLHTWKCPKIIGFTDQIPKNTMGKVLKDKIKLYFIKKV